MDFLPMLVAGVIALAIVMIAIGGLPAGVIILLLGGFAMFMGFMFIRKIVDIEV